MASAGYIGDFKAGDRVDIDIFTGTDSTGLPTAVTGGSACVIKRTSGTPAAGSLAGLGVQMTTSGTMSFITVFTGSDSTYYATGADYQVFWGYASIGATLITGYPLGHFSIQNRTLNWGSVSAPTTTVNLSGTTVKTATDVETDTADIQTRLPAALDGGRMDSKVNAMAAATIAAATFAAGAIDAAAIAANAIGSSEFAATAQNAVADAILLRDIATGSSASTTRNVQAALRMIVNKSAITGSSNPYTITFYIEDDTTSFQTAALTFSANTFGVSTADPA